MRVHYRFDRTNVCALHMLVSLPLDSNIDFVLIPLQLIITSVHISVKKIPETQIFDHNICLSTAALLDFVHN